MHIDLIRFESREDFTRGILMIDYQGFCFTIEDEKRTEKISGETRIPAGDYDLRYREQLTGLTKKYRSKFDWFEWHIEICDIPGFSNVYIHIGNTDEDTDGCPLLGYTCDMTKPNFIGRSTDAYKDFYKLFKGEGTITIHDLK